MHTLQYPEALLRNIFNPTGRLDGQSKGCRGGLVTPVMCGTPGNTARNALHPIMSINQPLLRLEENLCLACDNWLHTRQTLVEWCVLAPWDLIFFFDFWHFWGHFFIFQITAWNVLPWHHYLEKTLTPSPLSSFLRQSQHPLEQRYSSQDDSHIQLLHLPLNLIKWTLCWTLCWLSLFICLISSSLERHPAYSMVEKSATVNTQKNAFSKEMKQRPIQSPIFRKM